MRAFLALMRREYLSHRSAFVYAPLILIAILVIVLLTSLFTGHSRADYGLFTMISRNLFGGLYVAVAVLWWVYLLAALFFYCADTFNADRRNNAMLFWKSMPVSDFTVLASKFIAGMTLFPALIFIAMMATGVIVGIASQFAPMIMPIAAPPQIGPTASLWLQVTILAFCYMVTALLWYAPFFAWVGGLSTVVGRWSIPLALLVPVIFSLFEGVVDFGAAPGGSYVVSYLKWRLTFGFGTDNQKLATALLTDAPLDVGKLLSDVIATIDWPQLLGGLVVAAVLIWLASEYRRRTLKG